MSYLEYSLVMIHFKIGRFRYTYDNGELSPDDPETPADETARAQDAIHKAWLLKRWGLDYFPHMEAGVAHYLARVPGVSEVRWVGPPRKPDVPGRIY